MQVQIEKLTLQLGAFYAVPMAPEDPKNYAASHPGDVYLINPDMELQIVFKAPLENESDECRFHQDMATIRAFELSLPACLISSLAENVVLIFRGHRLHIF